ncbi:MAG: hypothetical protein HY553_23195 [Elusimicrobia bacterium]|nr:hypothetical protein [Elusimicrobiota bacterium]
MKVISAMDRGSNPAPAAVRRFRAAYLLIMLNFLLPALGYILAPSLAIREFERVGMLLGGGPYALAAGETGHVWRVLGATNVLTLAFMCGLLLWDLRRFYPVLVPLLFLKTSTAVLYLGVFLAVERYPAFLAVFALDAATAAAMAYFAIAARAALET